ncbi:hypothetical protein AB0F96_17985, partial [Streptomyces sp. NPDC023998]|uniref:hypothetical protein n=1 Tax=Streptomyces sp. NPDC023998 TaxID=3154597 RepID=UPI00340FEBE0
MNGAPGFETAGDAELGAAGDSDLEDADLGDAGAADAAAAGSELLGYRPHEIIGQPLSTFLKPATATESATAPVP